ncbi:MAG: hypothetical protein CME62_12655 [Halobacteriovoraceae bacterium]|nr:hypothetical protein [Halobacteriovoraceae bacterium]|tara:strand:- start:23878 stop:24537 length:660 start_codon:yes stop_codon:yes gene_type:complete
MKIAIIVLLVSLSSSFAGSICTHKNQVYFNTQIQTGIFADTGRCFISLSKQYKPNLIYRSHLFTSLGEHMVFNSFGPGPIATHTGARVFLHLPRVQPFSYQLADALVTLTLPNGNQVIFDAKNAQVIDSIGFDMQESPSVNRNNLGGINVYSSDHTWLDFGFTLGYSPLADLNREFEVHFPDQVCSGVNRDLFTLVNGNVVWKYKSDQALLAKLESLCL